MDQVTTKQQKSIYHIFVWIAIFSLVMIGLLEWGYMAGGRAFGNYKVYTGLVPWCVWIIMTYLATRPKWFTSRYNLGDMYKVHRALGIATVAVIAFHLYLYFGKAAKSILGWWGGYVALTSFGIATISGLAFLTPKLRKVTPSGRNVGIWLHRLNLIALVAADIHIHGFNRISKMVPFLQVFDIITYGLVIYCIYLMFKKR